jgi:phosphohistidine swiveling domain-containing protein
MAIVPNKDGQGIKANGVYGVIDPSYDVPTLVGTGVPATAALYASQLALDTATGNVYRALATGGTTWAETNIR